MDANRFDRGDGGGGSGSAFDPNAVNEPGQAAAGNGKVTITFTVP